jgi:uncharacterized protein (DUF2267 family)
VQCQEFIGRVQQQAGLGSFERAEAATRATLTVLGDYIAGGEGHDLAAQLPQGLAELLHRQSPARSFIFSLNDFLQRVGEEEGVESGAAEAHARAVVDVLKEAVSGGEMQDVRRQFPSKFDPLFSG